MNKQMIKVVGVQRDIQGEENSIELITEGKLYEKNQCVYIVYQESELSGMEGSTTTLKIEGENRVTMKRYGLADSCMVFEKGKRYKGEYKTPYGQFMMEMKTTKLMVALEPELKKGHIEMEYDISILGLSETQNRLVVTLL